MLDPFGLKATPLPKFGGNVLGLLYLVPNPEPDQGYAVMLGEEL
jgi:hypothetical protein